MNTNYRIFFVGFCLLPTIFLAQEGKGLQVEAGDKTEWQQLVARVRAQPYLVQERILSFIPVRTVACKFYKTFVRRGRLCGVQRDVNLDSLGLLLEKIRFEKEGNDFYVLMRGEHTDEYIQQDGSCFTVCDTKAYQKIPLISFDSSHTADIDYCWRRDAHDKMALNMHEYPMGSGRHELHVYELEDHPIGDYCARSLAEWNLFLKFEDHAKNGKGFMRVGTDSWNTFAQLPLPIKNVLRKRVSRVFTAETLQEFGEHKKQLIDKIAQHKKEDKPLLLSSYEQEIIETCAEDEKRFLKCCVDELRKKEKETVLAGAAGACSESAGHGVSTKDGDVD